MKCDGNCFNCQFDDCIASGEECVQMEVKFKAETSSVRSEKTKRPYKKSTVNWNDADSVREYQRKKQKEYYALKKFCDPDGLKEKNKLKNERALEKHRESNRRYYANNKEKCKEWHKKWEENHKEERSEYIKQYQKDHKIETQIIRRRYYMAHRQEILEQQKEYKRKRQQMLAEKQKEEAVG